MCVTQLSRPLANRNWRSGGRSESGRIAKRRGGPSLAKPGGPSGRKFKMDFRTLAEKETADFVARLAKASADAVAAAEKRVATEAKHAADEAQRAADAQRAELVKVSEALKTELQAAVKQKMAVAAALKEAQTQIEGVRSELKTAIDRGEVASRQLA